MYFENDVADIGSNVMEKEEACKSLRLRKMPDTFLHELLRCGVIVTLMHLG